MINIGNVKYSEIEQITVFNAYMNTFKDGIQVIEKEFEKPFDFIKFYNVSNLFKININCGKEFYICTGEELELSDFQVNSVRIESLKGGCLGCYCCR